MEKNTFDINDSSGSDTSGPDKDHDNYEFEINRIRERTFNKELSDLVSRISTNESIEEDGSITKTQHLSKIV